MEKGPENKEAPNKSEQRPQPTASEKVKRALGDAAIKGAGGKR